MQRRSDGSGVAERVVTHITLARRMVILQVPSSPTARKHQSTRPSYVRTVWLVHAKESQPGERQAASTAASGEPRFRGR
jgi:hypothetical protein